MAGLRKAFSNAFAYVVFRSADQKVSIQDERLDKIEKIFEVGSVISSHSLILLSLNLMVIN